MLESRNCIIFYMFVLLSVILYKKCSGLQVNLTRRQIGDYFTNPYGCDYEENEFCEETKSSCYQYFPTPSSKCCYCKCDTDHSTFNEQNWQCTRNEEYRQGCLLELEQHYDEENLPVINMRTHGYVKIEKNKALPDYPRLHKLKKCSISKVEKMTTTGNKSVANHVFGTFLHLGNKEFAVKWKAGKHEDFGRVYRISISCEYDGKGHSKPQGSFVDCVMLKSDGTIALGYLDKGRSSSKMTATTAIMPIERTRITTIQLETTVTLVTPTAVSLFSSSPSTKVVHSSINEEIIVVSTTKVSSTQNGNLPSFEKTLVREMSSSTSIKNDLPKQEEQNFVNEVDTVVVVVIVVVVIIIVTTFVVLACFTMARKKKKELKKHESRVEIVMSDVSKNISNEDDGLYTALGERMDNETNYHALNLPTTNTNIYADADRIYNTIDPQFDDAGAKNNAFHGNENEGIYSILEEQPGQNDYGTPSNLDYKSKSGTDPVLYSTLEENQISDAPPGIPTHEPAGCTTADTGPVYSTSEEQQGLGPDIDYVIPLPSGNQSDCSVYAELSKQRDENVYQSLRK